MTTAMYYMFRPLYWPSSGYTMLSVEQLYNFQCNNMFRLRDVNHHNNIYIYIYIYSVSEGEYARLRENVPYVKVYRYSPKKPISKVERLRR